MKTTLRDIAIEEIAESPHNPRRVYDEAALEELADSIREQGVLEPLLVRPRAQDPRPPGVFFPFELVAGHRRLRGARKAGLREVPCIVRKLDDAQALEAALVENGHREDVTPLDEATAFARLIELGREVHEIADAVRSQWMFEPHPSQEHGPFGIERLFDAIGTNPSQVLARARKRVADEERAAEKAAAKAKAAEQKKATKKARADREVRDGA